MMIDASALRRLSVCAALFSLMGISGCVNAMDTLVAGDALSPDGKTLAASIDPESQACLARAMYFESNRSSESGMLAVGTVVMNRVESPSYPSDVCEVVGQPRQFAPGVMTRAMGPGKDLAMKTAASVLAGKRHAGVQKAKFFHTAGLKFPYRNMHYVAIAGGNAFYQKVSRRERASIQMASQSDVRSRQKAQETAGTPVTAVALAPSEAERRAESPFASLWQALTDKPGSRSTGTGRDTGRLDVKGGRVTAVAARAQASAPADEASTALDERMRGLPDVETETAFSGEQAAAAVSDAGVPNGVPVPSFR